MMTPAAGPAPGLGSHAAAAARVVAERRWRLGVHSRGHPHRIIEDLLRGLAAQAVDYKKQAPYNYKCRKVFPALGARPQPSCSHPAYRIGRQLSVRALPSPQGMIPSRHGCLQMLQSTKASPLPAERLHIRAASRAALCMPLEGRTALQRRMPQNLNRGTVKVGWKADACGRPAAAAEVCLDLLARESTGGAQPEVLGKEGGRAASLPGSAERLLKFEVQMYKMRDGEYCIDIQVPPGAVLTPIQR